MSSSRYYYSTKENISNLDSINKYENLFTEYSKETPGLKEALIDMFIYYGATEQKSKKLYNEISEKINTIMEFNFESINIKYPLITEDEAKIICSYTCELTESFYCPYKIVNDCLYGENKEEEIKKISKYLFLFLKALRKLIRYYPSQKQMYRCIMSHVKIKEDNLNKKIMPYNKNDIKIFWGFTSITSKECKNKYYIVKEKTKEIKINIKIGTVFDIFGDIWGYDISLFNEKREEEILLEPERQILIMQIVPPPKYDGIIHIKCKVIDSPIVLNDLILPDGIIIKYINNYNFIRLFGEEFVNNNKDVCKIAYKGKVLRIQELLTDKNQKEIEIHLSGLSDITNMRHMFSDCSALISIKDFSKLNTYKITDMSHLFYCCKSLTVLPDISHWNTISVTDFSYMFSNCQLITSLPDISHWNTFSVTNLKCLFYNCFSLSYPPNISQWDTSEVSNMSYMFYSCEKLTNLPYISNLNTSKVKDISYMFYNCKSLKDLSNIGNWNLSKVEDMSHMFYNCESLILLPDDGNWNTASLKDIQKMFYNCESLVRLPSIISKLKTGKIINMSYLFYNCKSLLFMPDISKWDISSAKYINDMFNNCESLLELPDISEWNTKEVSDMSRLCYNCTSLLTNPDISKWYIGKFTRFDDMFTQNKNSIPTYGEIINTN